MKCKKRIALALCLCMLLPAAAAAAAKPQENAQAVTRGWFIDQLAVSSGEKLDDSAWIEMEDYFTDGASADNSAKWAFAKYVLNGAGSGDELAALNLNAAITRQEAAAMLGRYLDYLYTDLPGGCGTGAPDNYNIADWAQSGVSHCWMYGVIDCSGEKNVVYADGTGSSALEFRPLDAVSASEAKQWIKNANSVSASALSLYETENLPFADALIRTADTEGNWALSPYSLRMCLAMLANGAKGETQQELLDALQITDLDAFNEEVKELLARYDSYARIMSLDTANSVWLNQSSSVESFRPAFLKTMQDVYRAEAQKVTDENSVERVNAWVNEKTNGKIPEILTEQNRHFATALINAVYFKAAWANEFMEANTQKDDFTNADGTTSQVDMMGQTGYFEYYSTAGAEALKMDYRKYAVDNEDGDNWEYFRDADFSMYLIRTEDELDVQNFLDHAEFVGGKVKVKVPKFKVESSADLNTALEALGVEKAYIPGQADFADMAVQSDAAGQEHYLDKVLQKTYISIDEKGTEAAAVTTAMSGDGAPPMRPELVREFSADGPFYFVIRDNTNGEILFAGQYKTAQNSN